MYQKILKSTKQRPFNENIFGFDIETYSKKNKFYCASFYHPKVAFRRTFFEVEDIIKYLHSARFKGAYISATNLSFDFFGSFFKDFNDFLSNFKLLFRGSSLLSATSYFNSDNFSRCRTEKFKNRLMFIDTGNYASLSVESLGKLIDTPKLTSPLALGRLPLNDSEKEELITYNMQDAKVSCEGLRFLFKCFHDLGASQRLTIASTSLSLFRNHYLKDRVYFRHKKNVLLDQFKGYYGGRCEAFTRGNLKKYKFYDYVSMYPSIMKNIILPDPNSLRISNNPVTEHLEYEGMSYVTIKAPYMYYPLLPYRDPDKNKLLFPYGVFSGWYTHLELRKALDIGYEILKQHKTYWYKDTVAPFKEFVNILYEKRKKYKEKNNPMEYVIKIILNSLYGKFAQKFQDKDNVISLKHVDINEIRRYKYVEPIKNTGFARVTQDIEPSCFCIPVWSAYITSQGRINLHDALAKYDGVYCDTDSIMTNKEVESSGKLGGLCLENDVDDAVIVKPKFYLMTGQGYEKIKSKGLGVRLSREMFFELLNDKKISYDKFVKFKEAIRRGLTPNEIISIIKNFDLEDNKRDWNKQFNPYDVQESVPLKIIV